MEKDKNFEDSEEVVESSGNTSFKNISRRDFFKGGVAVAGGVALSGLISGGAVTKVQAQAVDMTGCPSAPWEKPAVAIADKDIKETINVDVLIIGAGLAGITTAVSAKEGGVNNIVVIDKNNSFASRGIHNGAFASKLIKEKGLDINYRQIVRELVRWAQGRLNEDLVNMWACRSGSAMDWIIDKAKAKNLKVNLWGQYYVGPDYTEYPVTHIFENAGGFRGNPVLVKAMEETAKEMGVKFVYRTPAVKLIREGEAVVGVIAGKAGEYTKYLAKKGVVLATGDYASNKEMCGRFSPIANMADAQIYFPRKLNTGDGHIMAMQAGGAMQKAEPHAAVIHLEAGAMSYGFLHVNNVGHRFKNEDVNTQSKSCSKLFEGDGTAWTVYDADGLNQVQEQIDKKLSGGLFYGQMDKYIDEKWSLKEETQLLEQHVKQKKVVTANSIEELAKLMNVPANELKKTVDRYNELAKKGNDEDYGKRKELVRPILKAPFYAGKLLATVLTISGGLRTDTSLRVLDSNDKPIKGLYVVGSAAGDFFAADYPTIVPGIGHGRCITFGRIVGVMLAEQDIDKLVPAIKI